MGKAEDTESMRGDEASFVFGRHADPVDPDTELREIAGSIAVNCDKREVVTNTRKRSDGRFVVRNISNDTFGCLQKVLPVAKRDSASDNFDGIINRLVEGILDGNPDWNVLRAGDASLGPDKLRELYAKAINEAFKGSCRYLSSHLHSAFLTNEHVKKIKLSPALARGRDFFGTRKILEAICNKDGRLSFVEIENGEFEVMFNPVHPEARESKAR